jgi:hypothetical protein
MAAGGIFALFYIINAIIQIVRQKIRIGFVQTWLAFGVVLLPVLGLVNNTLSETPIPLGRIISLGTAAVLIVLSLILLLIELRRPERLKQSRGLLGIGAGVLVAISTFSVPAIAEYAFAAVQPTPTPLLVAASSAETTSEPGAEAATSTLTRTPTPTATAPSTPTRRPTAVATATPTRYQFVTRTPLPTATLPDPCLALANFNLNLRAQPEADAEVLATIPFNNTITLFGHSDDSVWWFGEYEATSGWVKGEFLALSSSCDTLPERAVS